MNLVKIKVPDIGDFSDVDVIEVFVSVGDDIEVESPLISLETEKAVMDVPATHAGVVKAVHIKVGDKVSEGSLVVEVEATESASDSRSESTSVASSSATDKSSAAQATPTAIASSYQGEVHQHAKVVVLGAGPGGYTAAFRAADLGLEVTLIERWPVLGGVCLNVGCIPSKALLHAAKVIDDAADMSAHGITFAPPKIDLEKLRNWKQDEVVGKLVKGLSGMAKQRKVNVVHGNGKFVSPHHIEVTADDSSTKVIQFENCIIAAGSEVFNLPFQPDDERVIDSTGALELKDIPENMLVVGGGIIGLEMATVYSALGSKVTIVELTDSLIPGCDKDLVRPLQKRLERQGASIMVKTMVKGMDAKDDGIHVQFEGDKRPESAVYDKVLVAIGRKPNGGVIDADKAGVNVSERGFIETDKQMRTNVNHIFAIGDLVGQPMLAHKATHEAKVAAEVIAGHKRYFDARVIPSVAYTDPEIAWVGLTETDAKAQGIKYEKGVFPWAASGRALANGRTDGSTKLLFDPKTNRVLGAGIVGVGAGELIAEMALAIEMNADAEDIGLTIHPHPTLSETPAMAAEVFEGTITDLYIPKRK
ncbi:MAG: dihydrolipoyl dehydrogenase [Gammaproteobacteria bacterium]|nr:dihydrolipoyl dehydrogenase [Gammaproteobacteria bacterium]